MTDWKVGDMVSHPHITEYISETEAFCDCLVRDDSVIVEIIECGFPYGGTRYLLSDTGKIRWVGTHFSKPADEFLAWVIEVRAKAQTGRSNG